MPLFNSVLARRTFGYLLAGMLALLAIVAASIWLAARTVNHADEIARARSVHTLASTVLGALLDAETGQRGFLLTQADRYLEPYEQARQQLTNDLSRLRALAADDPRGAAILDRLVAVSNEKLAELSETIRLERAGQHAAALALVNDDLGKRLMDEARGLLAEFIGQAEARVNDRLKQLDDAVTLLMWTTIAGSILILVFTGGASYTVMSYTRGLIAAQREVVALNATLEDRVRERTAALSQANDEIQRFAYIVSHDLRSPLVNIMGFTSELETGIASAAAMISTSDAAGRGAGRGGASRSRRRHARGGALHPRLDRQDGRADQRHPEAVARGAATLQPEPVDLGKLLDAGRGSVQHQLDEARRHHRAAGCRADRSPTGWRWSRSFGNLARQCREVPGARSAGPDRRPCRASRSGACESTVKRQWSRHRPQDHERIFELFRRAGAQDRPGEGIGLAHVRALVRRLGGDITVQFRAWPRFSLSDRFAAPPQAQRADP